MARSRAQSPARWRNSKSESRKVDARAQGAEEGEAPAARVAEAGRARDRVEVAEDGIGEDDLESDEIVGEADLERLGLGLALDVGGRQARPGPACRRRSGASDTQGP